MFDNFDFNSLFTGLLNSENFNIFSNDYDYLRCPKCGLSYLEFKRDGKLGCQECYVTFHQHLEPLFNQIQGTSVHNGKIMEKSLQKKQSQLEIKKLKSQLQQAIKVENYEEAAKIRDQIKKLLDTK